MSITLKRWEPERIYTRQQLHDAVAETRTNDQKQKDYEQDRKQWKSLNLLIDVRT